MEQITPELRNGERQVAPTLAGIRADHVARYRWAIETIEPWAKTGAPIIYDFGCGVGYGSSMITKAFPSAFVVGVDASVQAIEYADLNWREGLRPTFVVHDLNDVPWVEGNAPADAVVLFEIIEHLADPLPLLRAVRRLLKPGGVILLSVPNEGGFPFRSAAHPNGVRFHHRHYRVRDLVDLMQQAGADWTRDAVVTCHQTGRESSVEPGAVDEARTLVVSWQPRGAVAEQPAAVLSDPPRSATVLIFQRQGGELLMTHPWPDIVSLPTNPVVNPETGPMIRFDDKQVEYAVANGSAIYDRRPDGTGELHSAEWTDPIMPRGGAIAEDVAMTLCEGMLYVDEPWPQRLRIAHDLIEAMRAKSDDDLGPRLMPYLGGAMTVRFLMENGAASYRLLQEAEAHSFFTRLPGATYKRPIFAAADERSPLHLASLLKPIEIKIVGQREPIVHVPIDEYEASKPAVPFADHPARGKRVALLGMGPSLSGFLDQARAAGGASVLFDEVWTVNTLADVIRCDRVFHMDDMLIQEMRAAAKPEGNIASSLTWLRQHPGPIYTSVVRDGYPGAVAYPVADVINATGHIYFNSTVAYAVAYAVAAGVAELSLFGCDFAYPKAHKAEKGRACVEFWIAVALERGTKVIIAEQSALLDTIEGGIGNLYGFDAVDLRFDQQRNGTMAVTMTPKAVLPTAEQIEEAYDHGIHPNALMRTAKKDRR